MNTSTSKYILLALSLAFFVTAQLLWNRSVQKTSDYASISEKATHAFSKLEKKGRDCVEKTIAAVIIDGTSSLEANTCEYDWFSVFVFQKDSLVWWSDNGVAPDVNELNPGTRLFKNGWYYFITQKKGEYTVSGLLKIKNQYAFQNRFLVNSFHPDLGIPEGTTIGSKQSEASHPVKASDGQSVFYISHNPAEKSLPDSTVPSLLYVISFLMMGVFLYLALAGKTIFSLKGAAALLTFATIIRLAGLYFQWPEAVHSLPLFSPAYYASSFLLNSLGDLLFSSLILAGAIVIIYRIPALRKGISLKNKERNSKISGVAIAVLITLLYSVFINHLLAGLIINSRISFNISNVFELDAYSFAGVVVIGILLFTFYKVADGNTRIALTSNESPIILTVVTLLTSVLFFAVSTLLHEFSFFSDYSIRSFLLSLFVLLFTGMFRMRFTTLPFFTKSVILILAFSFCGAYAISDFNNRKEEENRRVLAAKLENEQDQVAEYLFDDIASAVANDKVISRFFAAPYQDALASMESSDLIERRMTQLYFTGYWGRYDITVRSFNSEGLPFNTGGDPTWSLDFYNNRIRENGQPTASLHLFFSGNVSGRTTYTGMIPVFSPDDPAKQTGTIAVSLVSRVLQGAGGFPELLLSDKVPQRRDISNYSYALYRDEILVNQAGSYNYRVNSAAYKELIDDLRQDQFVHIDGYCHLFYQTADNGLLVISTKIPQVPEYITFFSYLFSFYGLCFIIMYGLISLYKEKGMLVLNFKNRIQATVIVIVIANMLLIGSATVYYIFSNHKGNISLTVNERLRSMLLAIRDELSTRSLTVDEISDEMNYTFSKLAGTLNTDFSIFSREGNLVYSTQPKIYDQSLIARTMNRAALTALTKEGKSLHIQYEEIGKLSYLSAYEPVRNNTNQVIGYINLPYFARQDELKKDISSFLVALINIYVLLFASAIFLTFLISNRITKPLQIIQQRLAKVTLGKRNELIEWNRDDEIGALVKEYNRMAEELVESAELLARSERESAWREMAKQVAHEIKNPLTPMKLSVQHLQRAWKEQSPDLENIMQRFTQTLIEQIDTLSNIATEFSNFAKMPKAIQEDTDVSLLLKNAVALFSGNENISITYYEHEGGNFHVFADKEQLIRVFSNLMKNAVQAIPADRQGHIHIELKNENNTVHVSVKDNGIGIPEDQRSRIFTPNFTTKTGGMGLGLTMVKNIVEQAGGSIRFTTETGEGTRFDLSLPEYTA